MGKPEKQWDFFLAHASPDKKIAEALYDQLITDFTVFLDCRSLVLGDDWDVALATAQKKSRITVVIVSSTTPTAYYQREEIAAAIALARTDEGRHRVVPIFIDDKIKKNSSVPYGLRLKHSVSISSVGSIEAVAQFLKRTLAPTLVMSKLDIEKRHRVRTVVETGLRLVPTNEFEASVSLGAISRRYVFIGDFDEQKFRTLKEILANLLIGDSFERRSTSHLEWTAITFKIGTSNYRKVRRFPCNVEGGI